MLIYFDTSVLVPYYSLEARTDDALGIVAKATLPVISGLGIAELNVVIQRKRHEGYLTSGATQKVFEVLDRHLEEIYVNVRIDAGHVAATRSLASRADLRLRTLDALHLAIAQDVGGAFDDRLATAARHLGVSVLGSEPRT